VRRRSVPHPLNVPPGLPLTIEIMRRMRSPGNAAKRRLSGAEMLINILI
jgi:hypothetical protein